GQAQSTSLEQRPPRYVMLALQSARFTRNMCDLVSHSSSGTSWPPESPTTNSAPTTSPPASIPNAKPAASSPNSKPSGTPSPSPQPPDPAHHRRPRHHITGQGPLPPAQLRTILVSGGLGFIGSHTTRAMLDLGESCVLVQRRAAAVPDAFASEAGRRVFVEQADITDRPAFLEIGKRHKITGIVHLAGSVPWPPGAYEPIDGARKAIDSLLNVIQAASDWEVARVGTASTIGVYGGVAGNPPYREDMPLPMTTGHVIPAFKKIGELLTDYRACCRTFAAAELVIGRAGPVAGCGTLGAARVTWAAGSVRVAWATHSRRRETWRSPIVSLRKLNPPSDSGARRR